MKDITTITNGVIMHQVNCQNVMGSGVAKALYTKYPQVKKEYHELAKKYDTPQKRTGMLQPVYINDELIICNSYSQMNYGTDKNVRYTNETLLINNLKRLDEFAKSKNLPAYVPEYIGCGLGNGDWNTIKDYIEKQTDIIIVSK